MRRKLQDKMMDSDIVQDKVAAFREAVEQFKKTSPPYIVAVWANGKYVEVGRYKTQQEAVAQIRDYDTFWMDAREITSSGKCVGVFEKKGTMAEIPVQLDVPLPPPPEE